MKYEIRIRVEFPDGTQKLVPMRNKNGKKMGIEFANRGAVYSYQEKGAWVIDRLGTEEQQDGSWIQTVYLVPYKG